MKVLLASDLFLSCRLFRDVLGSSDVLATTMILDPAAVELGLHIRVFWVYSHLVLHISLA